MRRTVVVILSLLPLASLPAQATVVSSASMQGAFITYDQARARLVFALPSRDIWEWDGSHWATAGARLPQPMNRALYDASRQRVFFFSGGSTSTSMYSYDGHSIVAHGAVPGSNMVADTHRGRLVAFSSPATNPTVVEWDGASWQTLAPISLSRIVMSAAYDANRHLTVVQLVQASPPHCETWEWDGTAWALRYLDTTVRAGMVFDTVRQKVVSFAGGVWSWNGATWAQVSTAMQPIIGAFGSDPAHGLLWMFAGWAGNREVLAWDGSTWTPRLTTPHPEGNEARLSFDSVRNRAVLTGTPASLPTGGVHEWDGIGWHFLAAIGPPMFNRHAQVFDPVRGETIVFGGWSGQVASGDTWAWNGANWRLAATTGPMPRANAAIAFDSARGRVVVVGGSAPPGLLTDHWEWDGLSWTLVSTTTPMLPALGALGYDPLRARLVFTGPSGHTWEHDGVQWSLITTTGPLPGGNYTMEWDPTRQRLQANLSNGQWHRFEWNGAQWTPRFLSSGVLAFDTRRGAMLRYQRLLLETESTAVASATDIGAPCGGTTTPTSLSAFGLPRPGDAAFHLDVRAEAAQRPALLGFGLTAGNVAIGNGCSLLLQNPIGSVLWFTDAHGFWHQPLALPNDLALRGVGFVAQAAVLDPASPGGLALSQGLQLAIGD